MTCIGAGSIDRTDDLERMLKEKAIFNNADPTLRDNLAMLCGMGTFVIFNYVGQRFLVFHYNKD